jgi:hypothetical protein
MLGVLAATVQVVHQLLAILNARTQRDLKSRTDVYFHRVAFFV